MSGDHVSCDGCESESSTLFCEQCNAYYCSACDTTAHTVKNARNHIRVSANAMENGRIHFCSSHSGKRAELFCNDCSELICLLCRDYGVHKDHNVELIENVSRNLRESLHQQIDGVSELTAAAKETLAKVEATLKDLDGPSSDSGGAGAAAKAQIDKHFDAIVNALHTRRDELLQRVDVVAETKERQLLEQAAQLVETVTAGEKSLENVRSWCRQDDLSVCGGYADTMRVLDKVKKAASSHLIPVADAEIPMSFDDLFLETIRHHGSVGGPLRVRFNSAANGVCTIEWDAPLRAGESPWESYCVKARMLSQPLGVGLGSAWTKVGGAFEKILGTVPANIHELTVVLAEHPGAVMEFSVMAIDASQRQSAWAVSPQKLRLPASFAHKTFDLTNDPFESKNGLFYYIGTSGDQHAYINPHTAGNVTVTWSSIGGGSVEQFVENEAGSDFCYTDDVPNSWMCVDLGDNKLFRPTAYGLRHDNQGPRGVLRNWMFQAKVRDHDEWSTLSTHVNDKSLHCMPGSVASFSLDSPALDGYRYFRILQNGRNSSDKNRLLCCGFELFGTLY